MIDTLISEIVAAPPDVLHSRVNLLLTELRERIALDKNLAPHPLDVIFGDEVRDKDRLFTSAVLLYVLSKNDSVFNVDGLRIKSFKLFDAVLAKSLYKKLDLKPNDQTYIKEQKLRDVFPDASRSLEDVFVQLAFIESVKKVRHEFSKEVSGAYYKQVLEPFIPEGMVKPTLLQALTSIERYTEHVGPGVLPLYEVATDAVRTFTSEIKEVDNADLRKVFESVGDKLSALLESHFASSPAYQPVQLEARIASKKYSLHQAGAEIDIEIRIKNAGPGNAYDVNVLIDDVTDLQVFKPNQYIGELKSGSSRIEFKSVVKSAAESCVIIGHLSWQNPNGDLVSEEFALELIGQQSNVDWLSPTLADPYSLEPVDTAINLVGRTKILHDLVS